MESTILEQLYFNETESRKSKLLSETMYTTQKTKDILQLVPTKNNNEVDELLLELGDEYLKIGYINGFKTCLKLINELQSFSQDNFLSNLISKLI